MTIFSFFGWRDVIEILFFAITIYSFSTWLKKDRQKNLLGYFYAYCLTACVAYHAQLTSVSYLLVFASPVIATLFILIHQHTLQKNFVTLRNIIPAHKDTGDWLDALMRSCLIAINNNKELRCVIEHNDNLQELLHAPLLLEAPIKHDLLDILANSPSYNHQQLLWVTSGGTARGINARWHHVAEATWNAESSDAFVQEALFFSSKTDALIFCVAPATRTFAIIVQGKLYENIRTANAVPFIKKYVAAPNKALEPGEQYVQHSKNSVHVQRSS